MVADEVEQQDVVGDGGQFHLSMVDIVLWFAGNHCISSNFPGL